MENSNSSNSKITKTTPNNDIVSEKVKSVLDTYLEMYHRFIKSRNKDQYQYYKGKIAGICYLSKMMKLNVNTEHYLKKLV